MPPDFEPDELSIHELFSSLRDHVVVALSDLADRVSDQLGGLFDDERTRSPDPSEVMGSTVLETLNLLTGLSAFGDDDDA